MAYSNANILSLDAASTNIDTGAYVQLSASTPIGTSKIVIVNTTSSIIALGIGASGSEVGLVAVGPSSTEEFYLGLNVMPQGVRLALSAISADATTGYVTVSLLP